jgi:hypothetical protein
VQDTLAIGRLKIEQLDRLPEDARALPTGAFDRASEFHYQETHEGAAMRLVLVCSAAPYAGWLLTLELRDIQSVLFPPLGPHLWLPQLEITEVRASNFEGHRFLVSAEEGSGFECYCGNVACLGFAPRSGQE